ncbi:MAG: transporter [Rhodobacteraceae bacterium]|nr:MAG: transporter [Paracoccaceae bacterium]
MGLEYAGGSYYWSESYSAGYTGSSITVSSLATCLGTPASNISGLTQNGADGIFASDNYIGFSFTLGTATITLGAGAHDFSVPGGHTGALPDSQAPVLTAPSARVANTDSGVSTASLDVTSLGSVSDNVDAGLSITYKVGTTTLSGAYGFSVGTTPVTMDAVDTAGNNAVQKSFTVTVSDVEVPVLTAPAAQTASTDSGVNTASLDVTSLGWVSDNVDSGLSITYKIGSTAISGAYGYPAGETTVTMYASDTAGNVAAPVSFTVTVTDAEAPLLVAPVDQTPATDSGSSTASLDVTGLGSVSDNVDSGLSITYKVGSTTLTGAYDFPLGETTVTMDASDTAGNDAVQVSFTVTVSDAEVPVLTAPAAQTASADAGGTIAALDVTALGSVSDNVDSGLSITFKVGTTTLTGAYDFPLGATTVTMDATDTAGNDAVQLSFTVTVGDTEVPVLTAPADQTADTDASLSTASLDVTDLGSVSDNVDSGLSITYKVGSTTLTGAYDFPVGETTVTMDASDTAGNDAVQLSFTVTVSDVTAPPAPVIANVEVNSDKTLTVTGTTEPGATVTVTFPDLTTATTVASGGAPRMARAARMSSFSVLSAAAQPGSFSVTSPTAQPSGDVTVTSTDINGNTSGASLTVADTTDPDVVISGGPDRVEHQASFDVTIAFSESVIGFVATDLVVTNASVIGFTGSGASYTATIASAGTGDVSISLPAGAAEDAAGNKTTASNTLVMVDTTVEETQKTIARFMYGRANQLIANQPDLTGFLSGTVSGALDAHVTRGIGNFNLSTGAEYPVWFQLKGAWSKDGNTNSSAAFGSFGSHRKISETVLLGAMLQFDHLSQGNGDLTAEGNGWLAGPYVVAKMPDQPLFFEARLLYGQSSNTVSPFGTYADVFDTARLLAQMKVAGSFEQGRTRLSPYLNAAYAADKQDAYQDSLGNLVPMQKVELMQIAVGLDVAQHVPLQGGDLELRAGVSGIWSNTGGTEVAGSVLPGYAGWRSKVNIGLNYASDSYGTFTVSTFLDGLGAKGYESYGLNLGYSLAF